MEKRKVIFDDYDTAAHLWTLASCSFAEPEPETELVEVPGRLDGPLDFSTALTGDIRFQVRPLQVRLESSEGTRLERKARIDELINRLHGQRVKIWLPDDPDRYVVGRLSIKQEYNDLAHAAVVVTASCEPWRYDNNLTQLALTLSEAEQEITLTNDRRPACPTIIVQNSANIEHEGREWALGKGTHKLPDLILKQGENQLKATGVGGVDITYRKAVL